MSRGELPVVTAKKDILQGTLVLMVLRTLAREPMHGYGITLHIRKRLVVTCAY